MAEMMYLTTNWFFGFDVLFELIFAFVTLAVSIYAFKIYKLTNQNQSKLFGLSFIFISTSYFIQSFMNFTIISELNKSICNVLKIQAVNNLNAVGIYVHMLFFTIGLVTLAYMTLRTQSKKTYSLLFVISISLLLLSVNKLYSFYFLSSILLIFITLHYLFNYLGNKKEKTLLVLVAFVFLLFGSIHFMFSVNHALFYVIGHVLGLIAYLLILTNLLLVLKNGKKKK